MNPTNKQWLGQIALTIGSLLLGTVFGVFISSMENETSLAEMRKAGEGAAEHQQEDIQRTMQLAQWQSRAKTCEANVQTATILYEPGAPPTVPLFNGLINVQPGGVTGPVGPRWIIPWKVVPRSAQGAQGFSYYYFDGTTSRLDGPYLPYEMHPGDQWNVTGWVSQH